VRTARPKLQPVRGPVPRDHEKGGRGGKEIRGTEGPNQGGRVRSDPHSTGRKNVLIWAICR